jgi:sugar phosphate isomerase/epimerase
MKLGAYTACLHDRPLTAALKILRELGLTAAEVNSGGFLPTPHLPAAQLRASSAARTEYLELFASDGVTLTALNCNGNPLHPDLEVREKHAQDLRDAISLAALLGVKRVVTMSGLPEAHAGGRAPAWVVLPWDSVYLDIRDYQWQEVAIPFWKDIESRARDANVNVCIEMHPHMLVYNPATLERLVTSIDATHIGAEMDPSHLFWQGIDPLAALERLGDLVYNAAAKDTRINPSAKVNGVLDDRFERVSPPESSVTSLGGRYSLTRRPADAAWDFVAVGRGHDVAYWTAFLKALQRIDPDMAVNIEHEDQELDRLAGLEVAADTLRQAASALESADAQSGVRA